MIMVVHYDTEKDPEIHFGVNEATEVRILKQLKASYTVARAGSNMFVQYNTEKNPVIHTPYTVICNSEKDWYGQDNPKYPVHHWHATKK